MAPHVLAVVTLAVALAVSPGDTALVEAQDRLETLRPAELVAVQVRRVLWNQASAEAWKDLEGALPGLAGPEVEVTRPPGDMSGTRVEGSETPVRSPLREYSLSGLLTGFEWPNLTEVHPSENEIRFAIWAVIAVLTVLVVPRIVRKGSAPQSGGSLVRSRLLDARAMAGAGRSITDIARETRLAQEALSVLLRREV